MPAALCLAALAAAVPADPDPPKARIDFPLPAALTDAATMRVRGAASDSDGVAAVSVNGVPASTTDAFANWWALVPLALGENALVVETEDALGNVDPAAAATLVRRDGAIVRRPQGLALDPASGTCFVFDWLPDGALPVSQTRILGADLATGALEVVSARSQGTGPLPRYASGEMEYDPVAGRLLLLDAGMDRLLAVDPRSGNRAVVSGDGVGTGPKFAAAIGLELDPENGRAWVFNRSFGPGSGALLGVDLATGNRSVVSSSTVGAGPWPEFQSKMSRAPGSQRLHVACFLDELVLGVDLSSGNRALVAEDSGGLGTSWSAVWDVAVADGGRAWAGSTADGRLFEFDPGSGAYAQVAAPPADDPGSILDVELDPARGRLLVADDLRAAILEKSLDGGALEVLLRNSIGGGEPFRRTLVRGLTVDRTGRAWMVDYDLGQLFAIDPAGGLRTLVSGGSAGAGPAFVDPIDVAVDDSAGASRLIVLDSGLKALLAVDPQSGDRSLVSGAGVGGGPPFQFGGWYGPSMEVAGGTGWVLDEDGPFGMRLLAVDLSTGDRSLVSGAGAGAGPELIQCSGVAIDLAGGRALTSSLSAPKSLLAVDLASGDRSVFSGDQVGSGPSLGDPVCVLWDGAEGRALVYGRLAGITAVDGATGDRERLAESEAHKGPGLAWPMSMALWRPQSGAEPLLFLGDHELTALTALDLAFDPSNGGVPAWRTIVSR